MRDRLHGVLADVIVESRDFDGFRNSDEVMARIKDVAGDEVEAMAPTMETFALMKWSFDGQPITRQVQLIGIKPAERAKTGDFAEFLVRRARRRARSRPRSRSPSGSSSTRPAGQMLQEEDDPDDPRRRLKQMMEQQSPDTGAIIGYAMGHAHVQGKDFCIAPPGTRVGLVFPQAGDKPKAGVRRLPWSSATSRAG